MTSQGSPLHAITLFYDSGPLLCLGASDKLRPSLDRHFRSRMRVVAAVHDELHRQSTEFLRPGHTRDKRSRKKAAQAGLSIYQAEFAASVPRPNPVPTSLSQLEDSMAEPGDHPTKHRGECESVFHARNDGHGFVTNDGGAGRTSRRANIRTGTFVDLARGLLALDRQVSREDVATELVRLAGTGIDIGERVRSSLDL